MWLAIFRRETIQICSAEHNLQMEQHVPAKPC